MKYLGFCHEKEWTDRYKCGCPKMHVSKGKWICEYKNPYNSAKNAESPFFLILWL